MATRSRNRKKPTKTTQVTNAGTTVRFEQPKSSRQPKPNLTVTIAQEVNPAKGFVNFIREKGVVSLAVGFAIATQAQGMVKQLIASFIDPLYALVFNGDKLSTKTFTLHFRGQQADFGWGIFAYTLLDFMFVLLAIYLIIKFFKLDELDKPKEAK